MAYYSYHVFAVSFWELLSSCVESEGEKGANKVNNCQGLLQNGDKKVPLVDIENTRKLDAHVICRICNELRCGLRDEMSTIRNQSLHHTWCTHFLQQDPVYMMGKKSNGYEILNKEVLNFMAEFAVKFQQVKITEINFSKPLFRI